MPVRNGVLCRALVTVGGGNTLIGTVPSTDTWIIKELALSNVSGAGLDAFAWLLSASGGIRRQFFAGFLGNNGVDGFQGTSFAGPGDQVWASCDAGSMSVWVGGADLPGHL